jgi:hypothetical protein
MGIPMDSADNQLKNGSIILVLQILKWTIKNCKLLLKEMQREYSEIRKVMDIFKQKINSFSLITGLKEKIFN